MNPRNPEKRYVRFKFDGYAPAGKAIQIHLLGLACTINEVGETLEPYQEEEAEHD